jgi:uncharacterized protein (DUF302 family)/uncharacterized protein YndB with AHSA1/START domain
MKGFVLSVERLIRASPEVIFDLLADPSRHAVIDGSGMLQEAKETGRLALGSTFGMAMKMGVRYSTVSTVVEFEENRLIAWQTGPKGRLGDWVAGRIWRYELEPRGGGTMVRESWDITTDHQRALLRLGDIWSGKTRRDMELTLARLDAVVTGSVPEIINKLSPESVEVTLDKLAELVEARGMKVFVIVDHSGEASRDGLQLRETKLVIFGSPTSGTPVMQASPLAALDLPLKVLVWDNLGQTTISYTDPDVLAARHHLTEELASRLTGIGPLTDALIA